MQLKNTMHKTPQNTIYIFLKIITRLREKDYL